MVLRWLVLFGLDVSLPVWAIVPETEPSEYVQSLNGTWKFKLYSNNTEIKTLSYQQLNFDDREWSEITVPGNWELQGFEEPQYGTPVDSAVGIYRRTFSIPAQWRSRHVIFYSEGIAFGYELWINGNRIGSFESAFQRAEFDITEHILYDQANLIAIRVYRDHYSMRFDCTDDWALSGIFREVYLFAAPLSHIEDVTVQTRITEGPSPAAVYGTLVVNQFDEQLSSLKNLSAEISLSFQGKELYQKKLAIQWQNGTFLPDPLDFFIPVMDARAWTAETPNLYDLQLTLKKGEEKLHSIRLRVGIRQIRIKDHVLEMNGQPIKLRGVCRLEIHPALGRALDEKKWLEDIELMKKANINAIRMTHWPPHPQFLDLCDRYGFYIIDEVPFDFGDEKLPDPLSLGALLARAQNTIDRDKNHPAVILWSIGNEHPSTRTVTKTAQLVKMLDASRPVLYADATSHKVLSGIPPLLDIYAPHYISAQEIIDLAEDSTLQKPVILTEYNHSLDVAFDGLGEKWENIEKYAKMAGGMIWNWSDQGLYRKVNGREVIDSRADINALPFNSRILSGDFWLDQNTILDSHGQYGTDGIVYADRVPQTDYWQTRKVYAPVKMLEKEQTIGQGDRVLELTCLNRYDFTNLDQTRFYWHYRIGKHVQQSGQVKVQIAPHDSGKIRIPVHIPNISKFAEHELTFTVVEHNGRQIYEHAVHLLPEAGRMDYRSMPGPAPSLNQLAEMQRHPAKPFPESLTIFQKSDCIFLPDGLASMRLPGGLQLNGPYIRVGRKPTMAERRTLKDQFWQESLLSHYRLLKKEYHPCDTGKLVYLEYECLRADDATQKIDLALWLHISNRGELDVCYELQPEACQGYVQELGLAFHLLGRTAKVEWLGDGPYPAYPFKNELSIRGLYTLACQDRYFDGNRMNVDVALLTDKKGHGLAILGKGENICWEQAPTGLIVSHNVKVASAGTKGSLPRALIPIKGLDKISGRFRMLLLIGGKYPDFLADLF
jgi:beta-galactosidase